MQTFWHVLAENSNICYIASVEWPRKDKTFLWRFSDDFLEFSEIGVTTISFGVTGYSFPWDQVGYWASKIVTSVPEALDNLIPAIGKISVRPFRGCVGQTTF